MAEKLSAIGINIPSNILSEALIRESWNVADAFEDGHLEIIQNVTIGESAYDYLKVKFNYEP